MDTNTKILKRELSCDIIKKSDEFEGIEQRLVYGEVLIPDIPDLHQEYISAEMIERTAHHFLMFYGNTDYQHQIKVSDSVKIVESYIAPVNFEWNGRTITKGSWILAVKVIDDKIWKEIKEGKLNSFSIVGLAQVEAQNMICSNCKTEINYEQEEEIIDGLVECPNCGKIVDYDGSIMEEVKGDISELEKVEKVNIEKVIVS